MKARLPKEYQSRSQAEMLKQAQQMQADMEKMQAELDDREYTATAGGNMVEVTVTGKHNITSLKINPELIADAADDHEMLEDLIITAVNSAVKTASEASDSAMSQITSGLNIPGLF